ncbi:chloride channel protein [Candidatus Binatus sp.]|jgi:CIC family chloride channel protein|uniref:chloride channel protein n=1 Tax=Candidatus Binatus sp. TaxID=2811406 RepID=UPI003BE549FE
MEQGTPLSPPAAENIADKSQERTLEPEHFPSRRRTFDMRVVVLTLLAAAIGLAAGGAAVVLLKLIGLMTNLFFYGRLSTSFVSPAANQLGLLVLVVPVIGGVVVGLIARYGSEAIRGHGIPEVMLSILRNQSRIPPRVGVLKPISTAIAIGTGCPFGAEGPIIVTGGAIGSFVGQFLSTTAEERKILLSAGAAAGMSATFGSPVSGVLLAVELLLFEFRPRSLIPVAVASAMAAALRKVSGAAWPMFPMHQLQTSGMAALASYTLIGAIVGLASVGATRAVYAVEDTFAKMPIHWMWWPAMGGLVVGIVGYILPETMGVGYVNIVRIFSGSLTEKALIMLCMLKFVSWAVALGSGTSAGTLAPLFVMGGALGAALGGGANLLFPQFGIDLRIAGIVGMAAMFAGASRALLTSIVFAFETTLQPLGLLPLLSGSSAAYMVSSLLMRTTLMTEKVVRKGVFVPSEYTADFLAQMLVRDVASREVVSLGEHLTLAEVRSRIAEGRPGSNYQGFPVLNDSGQLIGVVTRRDLLDPARMPTELVGELTIKNHAVIFEDNTLSEANELMVSEGVGRLPVVDHDNQRKVIGIISRRDIMSANHRRIEQEYERQRGIRW